MTQYPAFTDDDPIAIAAGVPTLRDVLQAFPDLTQIVGTDYTAKENAAGIPMGFIVEFEDESSSVYVRAEDGSVIQHSGDFSDED